MYVDQAPIPIKEQYNICAKKMGGRVDQFCLMSVDWFTVLRLII